MNMPVLVDWLTLLLAPIVIVAMGLAVYARLSTRRTGDTDPPRWGRVAQGVGVACALLIGLIQIVWGN